MSGITSVDDPPVPGWARTTPRTGGPLSGRYYRPELDALRFAAFLCVFCFHIRHFVTLPPMLDFIASLGAFGVPVFFLLSAFLITELLSKEVAKTGRVHVTAFYVRRILRIWPLYFTAFWGLVLLNNFLPGVGATEPLAWLFFSVFAGNWYVTSHGWIAGTIDPLWSISVEEQFYLFIPLVLRFARRGLVIALTFGLMLISAVTVALYGAHRSPGDHGEWANTFVHLQFFAAGMLLSIGLRGRIPALAGWMRLVAAGAAGACWVIAALRFNVRSWDPQPTMLEALAGWGLVLCGCVLLFIAALGIDARLVPRRFALLGRVSYGLYVFHCLVIFVVFQFGLVELRRHTPAGPGAQLLQDTLGAAVALAASAGLAALSYRYFERPFLQLKERFTFVAARD